MDWRMRFRSTLRRGCNLIATRTAGTSIERGETFCILAFVSPGVLTFEVETLLEYFNRVQTLNAAIINNAVTAFVFFIFRIRLARVMMRLP